MSIGNVSNMCLPKKRKHMVLAQRINLDIFYYNHLAIFFLKHSASQYFRCINIISVGQKLQSLSHTFGRLDQSLPFWVFTNSSYNSGILSGIFFYLFLIVLIDFDITVLFFTLEGCYITHLFKLNNGSLFIRQNIRQNYSLFRIA